MTFTVIDKRTGQEADLGQIAPKKIAPKEEWTKRLAYCDMQGFAIDQDGTLILLDECGNYAYCPPGRFEIRYEAEAKELWQAVVGDAGEQRPAVGQVEP